MLSRILLVVEKGLIFCKHLSEQSGVTRSSSPPRQAHKASMAPSDTAALHTSREERVCPQCKESPSSARLLCYTHQSAPGGPRQNL